MARSTNVRRCFQVWLFKNALAQSAEVTANFLVVNHRGDLIFTDRDPGLNYAGGNVAHAISVFRSGSWTHVSSRPVAKEEADADLRK